MTRRHFILLLWIAGAAAAIAWYLHGISLMWGANPLFRDESTAYDQRFYITRAMERSTGNEVPFVTRSRMPLYPVMLSPLHDGSLDEWGQIERYMRFNVTLGICGLLLLFLTMQRRLGVLLASLATLAAAFTFYLYKIILVQPEITFYSLHGILFVLMLECLHGGGWRLALALGLLGGVVHLLKGSALLTLAAFGACLAAQALWRWWCQRRQAKVASVLVHLARPAAFAAGFLVVTGPFLLKSWRAYGSPLYDPNTKYYLWVDSPPEMRALQHLELATRKPELNEANLREPLVQHFLPKWLPDEARRAELLTKVAREKVVVLEGEWEILPTARSWMKAHGLAGFLHRVWQGIAGHHPGSSNSVSNAVVPSADELVAQRGMLWHNFRHPNRYIWHLIIFGSAAAGGLLLMLLMRRRECCDAIRRCGMPVFFAAGSLAANLLAMGFWCYMANHNRFFLGLFIPLLYCFALTAKWSLGSIPWGSLPGAARISVPRWLAALALPAPLVLVLACCSLQELSQNLKTVAKLKDQTFARKMLRQ